MNGSRYAYLARICELVANGKDLIIVSDDYAAPVLDDFRKNFPARYLSVGIAEQNLIAVSCGLAMGGKRVIAYGMAPFPLIRALDQIKNVASIMNLPINIVVAGIGFGVPEWGATHYNIDDIAFTRVIPNLRIITPSDNIMGELAADYALVNTAPVYVRFDKNVDAKLYSETAINFERGFSVLREGVDIVVISCGSFLNRILRLADIWMNNGINATVIDLFSLPFNQDALCKEIGNFPVITIEEHVSSGGIGSIILEMFNFRSIKNPIRRLGVSFDNGYPQTSGNHEYYLEKYSLSDDTITMTIVSFLASIKSMVLNKLNT
jgi:transketolase